MEENRKTKVSGLKQIDNLKAMLQKWQANAINRNNDNNGNNYNGSNNDNNNNNDDDSNKVGISAATCKRPKSTSSYFDSDEDSCQSPETPFDVPKGYLAVYVGRELQRFIIPTTYLTHPLFKVLLEKVEEEFGFDHSGGLTFPCEVETFKYLLKLMEIPHDDDQPQLCQETGETSLIMEE